MDAEALEAGAERMRALHLDRYRKPHSKQITYLSGALLRYFAHEIYEAMQEPGTTTEEDT